MVSYTWGPDIKAWVKSRHFFQTRYANDDVEAATGHTKSVARVTSGETNRANVSHFRVTAWKTAWSDLLSVVRGFAYSSSGSEFL